MQFFPTITIEFISTGISTEIIYCFPPLSFLFI